MKYKKITSFALLLFACLTVAAHDHKEAKRKALDEHLTAPQQLLAHVRAVTTGKDHIAPMWAPNGKHLSFSTFQYQGLYVLEMDNGSITKLVDDAFSGYAPKWAKNSDHLFYRQHGQGITEALTRSVSLEGRKRVMKQAAPLEGARFQVRDTDIVMSNYSAGKRTGNLTVVTQGGDRYFAPVLSPDGMKLLYEGIASGIYVLDLNTHETIHVGRGNHPAWSSDSLSIVFDRSQDNGYELLSSELFLFSLMDQSTVQLTDTKDALEQRPSFSPDGKWLAFDRDGAIFIGALTEGR